MPREAEEEEGEKRASLLLLPFPGSLLSYTLWSRNVSSELKTNCWELSNYQPGCTYLTFTVPPCCSCLQCCQTWHTDTHTQLRLPMYCWFQEGTEFGSSLFLSSFSFSLQGETWLRFLFPDNQKREKLISAEVEIFIQPCVWDVKGKRNLKYHETWC